MAKRRLLAIISLVWLYGCRLVVAAPVIGIADGDTLTVLEYKRPVKIRLANIDAPEKRQPYGMKSKKSLSDLCWGTDVTYKIQAIDRYKRVVAVVYCNGVEANRHQVKSGMAWVYTRYNKDPLLPAFEEKARLEGLGLWADRNPIPPWSFRKKGRL